jgi:GT2 family glycosyltransferase
MREITVILTCFNRREKTLACIQSIAEANPSLRLRFIIVDDRSSDGTAEALRQLPYRIELIEGTGNLYWCGGMRLGLQRYLELKDGSDCLLINDDVVLYPHAIEQMIRLEDKHKDTVIVGATQSRNGEFTYGLRKHRSKRGIYLEPVEPNKKYIEGDTMNANCVLLPYKIISAIGNLDPVYSHSLGDYDLGFMLRRKGYRLISHDEYVGICELNRLENTWRDVSLKRRERLIKKEDPKGIPRKEWFHFLKKNYGFAYAVIYSVIPYIKIAFGV